MREHVPLSTEDDGFTLMELLVAMAVMAMIGVLIAGALRFGVRGWEAAYSQTQARQEVEAAQSFLRTSLGGIYPARNPSSGGSRGRLAIEGGSQEIRFMGPAPKQLGAGGFVATRFFVERAAEGQALKIEWCLDQTDLSASPEEACVTAVLLDHLFDVKLTYWPKGRATELARWQSTQDLPGLIKLSVAFGKGDRRLWPDFYVRPLIDEDASCRYDPISRRCRGARS